MHFEEYRCGCVSPDRSKRDLPGRCSRHGEERQTLYKVTGYRQYRKEHVVASGPGRKRKQIAEEVN